MLTRTRTRSPLRSNISAAGLVPKRRASLTLVLVTLLLTLPYIKWFGLGTPTDVQLYPLAVSLIIIATNIRLLKHRDLRVLALVVAAAVISILQIALGDGSWLETGRGVFGYVSIGFLVLAWVLLFRRHGPHEIRFALSISFWLWLGVGTVQLINPDFGDFWRDKLIITSDRGSLSLATEPAYFAFALTILALVIVLLGGNYIYLLVAAAGTVLVAQSAVGFFYALAVVAFFSPARFSRKLAVLAGVLVAWFAVLLIAPSSRVAQGSLQLITDPRGLVATDMSVGLRYINLEFPLRAFLDNGGMPHGVNAWAQSVYDLFGTHAQDVAWRIAFSPDSSGRILSIHGQLIFELGVFAAIYYIIIWRIVNQSEHRISLAIVIFIVFLNGLTLNSPFFGLLLAAAFFAPEGAAWTSNADFHPNRRAKRPERFFDLSRPS